MKDNIRQMYLRNLETTSRTGMTPTAIYSAAALTITEAVIEAFAPGPDPRFSDPCDDCGNPRGTDPECRTCG